MMAPADAPESDDMKAEEKPMEEMLPVNFWAIDMGGSNWVQGIGEEIVNEFHEANPGEKVNVIVTTYGDTINKLPTVVAGGIPPDISYIDAYLPKGLRRTRHRRRHHELCQGLDGDRR